MKVAGLDLSTRHLDFVLLDSDNPSDCEHRRVTLADRDGAWWESAREMAPLFWDSDDIWGTPPSEMCEWLYGVKLLGIERPYGPSRGSIASLHTILGAVLATIPSHITCLEVRPAEMRKALELKGNVTKEAMHQAVYGRIYHPDRDSWPPDALDAWAVAWAAYRMCDEAAG